MKRAREEMARHTMDCRYRASAAIHFSYRLFFVGAGLGGWLVGRLRLFFLPRP